MRQGSNGRRGRGRGSGRKPQNNRNQSFDSNGPSGRIRGTATQLHEKYLTLARDASASGDRITAENCYQHADHYYRIVLANQAPPDPYLEEPADLDGDDSGYRQNGRDNNGRDSNGRGQHARDAGNRDGGNRDGEQGQRRRVNGNGHDVDGNQDGEERRTRRRNADAPEGTQTDDAASGNEEEVRTPPRRRASSERSEQDGEEKPRERRRTRRPSASASPEATDDTPAETPADDAELKRALGVAPPSNGGNGAEANVAADGDEPEEKPRRRRRAPSTRVSD